MAGHNQKLAQSIIQQRNLTTVIKQNSTKVFANTSLCGCTTTSCFRSTVMQIVFHPWFDKFILLTIFANCIVLSLEDPSDQEPDPIMEMIDFVFLFIFSVEMILKIIAIGFFMEPYSYLRDPWNVVSALASPAPAPDFSLTIVPLHSLTSWSSSWGGSPFRRKS